MKPIEHAKISAKKFGGDYTDYLEIHRLMDSSEAAFADVRHRCLTHNSWFVTTVVPMIYPSGIKNSSGQIIDASDVAEQHILDDFGKLFVPTPSDFLVELPVRDWMDNAHGGAIPPSRYGFEDAEPRINQRGGVSPDESEQEQETSVAHPSQTEEPVDSIEEVAHAAQEEVGDMDGVGLPRPPFAGIPASGPSREPSQEERDEAWRRVQEDLQPEIEETRRAMHPPGVVD